MPPFWSTVLGAPEQEEESGASLSAPPSPRDPAVQLALEARAIERRRLLFGGAGKRKILPEKRGIRKDPRLLALSASEKEAEAKRTNANKT